MKLDIELTKKQEETLSKYLVLKKMSKYSYNFAAVILSFLNEINKERFDNPEGVAAALYTAGFIANEKLTLKECAKLADVSPSLIRYRVGEITENMNIALFL